MNQNKKTADPSACVHCHLCQKNCAFLGKYGIDIGDVCKLEPLAYHCFLCGTCSQVCPKGIDGREIILNIRRRQVRENKGRVKEKGYSMLIKEKKEYLFQNYRNGRYRSVLFPGCNFPSFYPETTRMLADLLWKKDEVGIIFDCCGKPVAELGMEEDAQKIAERIDHKLQSMQVEELIMVCPNCYAYLKDRLSVKVVMIYDKLRELGIGKEIEEKLRIFPPWHKGNPGHDPSVFKRRAGNDHGKPVLWAGGLCRSEGIGSGCGNGQNGSCGRQCVYILRILLREFCEKRL